MLREISRKYYAEEFQLGTADVDDLIDEALSTLRKSTEEFDKLFAQGTDMAAVREAAHAMKGNLLNMGLEHQADIALDIEHSENINVAREHYTRLKHELDGF